MSRNLDFHLQQEQESNCKANQKQARTFIQMAYKTDFSKIDLDKYYFDDRVANLVVQYIEDNVKHVKGDKAGEPFILEQWQKDDIIKPLFGWKHKDTDLRKYTSAYIEIPKKIRKVIFSRVTCLCIYRYRA